MKKTTFLLGLPRCGSLALSIINNNDYCYAHHEGLDFSKEKKPFDETACSILMNRAHRNLRHYFCCDASLGPDLIAKYCENNISLGLNPTRNLQVVRIVTSNSQSTDSMSLLTEADEMEYKVMKATIAALKAKLEEISYHLTHEAMVPTLTIIKTGRMFDYGQIVQIANFVGSWPERNLIEQRKMEYLSKVPLSITKEHINTGLLPFGW